jgi:Ca2+-binding RTX toxin-like protein
LFGGAGQDLLYGAGGKDRLWGDAGADLFVYRSAAESSGVGHDQLVAFDAAVDRIDLLGDIGGLSAVVSAGSLSTASFDVDLATIAAALGAGQAMAFTADSGDLAARLWLIVDGDGQAGYQAGADLVIELVEPAAPIAPGADFFV